MRNLQVLACLLLCFIFTPLQAEQPRELKLYSRADITAQKFNLSDSDWRWLGEKREVKIAVYAPDNPPFDMVPDVNTYEGISADYTLLVMHSLGLRFQILHYPNRKGALDGLRQGQADIMVDDAGGLASQTSEFRNSIPYTPERPVLISRNTVLSKSITIPQNARIAIVRDFLSIDWVKRRYPGAIVSLFSSPQSALSSVAFGESDYFIGNLSTASFLIERNYATTLSIAETFTNEVTGPRFVFRESDLILQRSVDAVIGSLSSTQHKEIFRHWSQGPGQWVFESRLSLTEREIHWLRQNAEIQVVMNPLYAPFTLLDSQGQFQGIAADVLRLIHLRTGLNFKTVNADSVPEMFKMVHDYPGRFLAAMSYSPARDRQLMFTRPYVMPPFVLVVRDSVTSPKSIATAKTIAITPDNVLKEWLKKTYPDLKLLEAENASVAMKMVGEGKADGAVNNLIGARYMIDRYFRGELKIATRLGEDPALISFAVGRDQPELYSILNKALADIPPSDISLIANKWLGTPDVKLDTWTVYRTEFYWMTGVFALLVITSLIWNYYLHQQIRLRQEAQTRLEEQAEFLETLFNGTPTPVYVVGPTGEILNYNTAWKHFFASISDTVSNLPLTSQQHPLAQVWGTLSEVFDKTGNKTTLPQRYSIDNGTGERIIIHQTVAFKDRRGDVAGIIGCLQDITEYEQLLADVSNSRERAEQANRSKSTFLATMSHEIRTPISAIIGLLELVVTNYKRKGDDSETLRVAYESAQSLMGLIGDILDMAKIESGKLALTPEWVPFDTLAMPVIRVFDGLARQKGLLLESQIDTLHPDEIRIDPGRLHQILSNLVSNAIKFTEKGSVNVQVRCTTDDNEKATLELTVMDTGVGIAEEEQCDLFNPYVQAESGKKQSGTGLGLAICQQLTSKMGGEIALNSRMGRGTRITVRIPVSHREANHSGDTDKPEPPKNTQPLNILAVDDHPANRLLLRQQLIHLGHHVSEAENGDQALTLCRDNIFDLIITDCNMPVIDGLELTRLLRQEHKSQAVILGLTANAQSEERARCLAAGMDDCLFKPLRLTQLEVLLNDIPRRSLQPLPLEKLVNLTVLRELTQYDNELLNKLLITTRDENTNDMGQANIFLTKRAWDALAKSLHRLAGAAKIIGANHVEKNCRELEHSCENYPEEAEVIMKFQCVTQAVTELNHAIEEFVGKRMN